MALLNLNFESTYLRGNTNVSIILSNYNHTITCEEYYKNNKKYKVLWLLHGSYCDNSDWVRKSNIERYATERDLIVVMPTALNSDYVNWENFGIGYYMFDFLIKELMPLIYGWFPASEAKEDNYIAGLSMGGFGALLYGLNYPEKFNGIGVLSAGLFNPEKFKGNNDQRRQNVLNNIKGYDNYLTSYQNSWEQFKINVINKTLPNTYVTIGKEDFMYKTDGLGDSSSGVYIDFKNYANSLNSNVVFVEHDGYAHTWEFWDKAILDTLKFFKL